MECSDPFFLVGNDTALLLCSDPHFYKGFLNIILCDVRTVFFCRDDNDDDEVFIGRDLAHTRGYGEGVATAIDQEVKRIIDECYAKARQIITENRSVLDACAKLLLEKEKISQKEFEALFETDHVVL